MLSRRMPMGARRALRLGLAPILAVTLLLSPRAGLAAAVALEGTHMAASPGGNMPAVVRFPSGVATVYFDYTVRTPVADDTGRVVVYAGGTSGAPIAQAHVLFDLPASLDVALAPATGVWPDGAYCTVLIADGAQDTANGSMPIGWTVGKGSVPRACAPRLRFESASPTASHHAVHLRLVVGDSAGRTVAGAAVTVTGQSVGMAKPVTRTTEKGGVVVFPRLRIARAGLLRVHAAKAGYRAATLSLSVAP